ncbi:MAG: RsmD family RNA methyltransferase [Synergistaceae bacterium]|jgi:16S rRNA G966 N2-methylase RsmD|nr:RsmD family RNA methyltransferase [Synergistaceae bacterium]
MNKMARPTSSKVISALFNILRSSSPHGAPFLDLFAGTGSVARRALEEGASCVLCVESDAGRANAISRGFADAGFAPERASCVRGDVRRVLPRLAKSAKIAGNAKIAEITEITEITKNFLPREFGVVFADPPYCAGWGASLLPLMADNWDVVKPGGVFIFEHSSREHTTDFLMAGDDKIYGETVLSFYWKREVSNKL